MPRLPIPGQDNNTWGDILNEYLLVSHVGDGTLKPNAVTASHIRNNAVTFDKLSEPLRRNIQNAINNTNGGQDGADGREVELRLSATHIQWRYASSGSIPATDWTNLVALADITGPQGGAGDRGERGEVGPQGQPGAPGLKGDRGDTGPQGLKGDDGADGRPVQLEVNSTHIRWRLEGDTAWTNLVALAELGGGAGTPQAAREIELRTYPVIDPMYIQWRYVGEVDWTNLVEMTVLKGNKGDQGERGEKGDEGSQGLKGDTGEQGPVGPAGPAGEGVAADGMTGQILAKKSPTAYDTEWVDVESIAPTPEYATTTLDGIVRRATVAETVEGTEATKYVTPEGVKAAIEAVVTTAPAAGSVLFVDKLADVPPGTPIDTLVVVRAA